MESFTVEKEDLEAYAFSSGGQADGGACREEDSERGDAAGTSRRFRMAHVWRRFYPQMCGGGGGQSAVYANSSVRGSSQPGSRGVLRTSPAAAESSVPMP
jgi:hypothetical protein